MQRANLPAPGALRVTGALTEPARLVATTGRTPHLLLLLHFAPAHGLPYRAKVSLGADVVDHMAAEALLPHLGAGACVTVAAEGLALHTEHGQHVLELLHGHSVLLLEGRQHVAEPEPNPQASLLEV